MNKQSEISSDKNLGIISQGQLLRELGLTLPTLISYRKKGLIKAHRLGSKIFYKVDEITQSLIPTEV